MRLLVTLLLTGSIICDGLLRTSGNVAARSWSHLVTLSSRNKEIKEGVREIEGTEGNKVLEYLSSLHLESRTFAHGAVYTVDEQSDEIADIIQGKMTKNTPKSHEIRKIAQLQQLTTATLQ